MPITPLTPLTPSTPAPQQQQQQMLQEPILPPELLQRLVAAQRMQSNAAAASEEAKRAHELRGYAPQKGEGYGNVYQAAPLHGQIGKLMQALGREYKYDEAAERARALREQVDPTAEQELEFRTAEERLKIARQHAMNNQGKQTDPTQPVTYKYKEGAKLYQHSESGEEAWLVRADGSDGSSVYLDDETKQPVALTPEWRLHTDNPKWIKGVPKRFQEEARGSRKLYSELSKLTLMAQQLTPQQQAEIDKPLLLATQKAMTPKAFEQYVMNEALGLSPETKKFLARASQIDAGIRNKLFGAALTQYEGAFAAAFLQSTPGISFADRMDRVDNIVGELKSGGKAITGGNRDLFSDLEPYFKYQPPRKVQPQGDNAETKMNEQGLFGTLKDSAGDFLFGTDGEPAGIKKAREKADEFISGVKTGGKPASVAEFEAMAEEERNAMPEADYIRRVNEMNEYYKGVNSGR